MASLERRVAVDAARAAGRLLRDELSGARRIAYKGSPTNLVTEMDQRAEALILERLRGAFPDDAILAEEHGAAAGRSGRRWIVDPLDGTTNYAHGVPVFGVSIALEEAGRPVLGVVYDPTRDELFVGERGAGATLNDVPIRVSATATIGESLLVTGFPYDIRETTDTNLKEYAAMSLRAQAVRRLGSAVIDLAYVACGRLDAFWEMGLSPWDMAAGALLVTEAGGLVADLQGEQSYLESGDICAATPKVLPVLLGALRG